MFIFSTRNLTYFKKQPFFKMADSKERKKEYMKNYAKEKLTCPVCSGSYDKTHLWMHLRTKKHQLALMLIEKNNIPVERLNIKSEDKIQIETCDICHETYLSGKYKSHCNARIHKTAENLLKFLGKK